jgi:hypothetical protein
MAVRLSALCAGCPLPPGRFLALISAGGWVHPMATVQLQGFGQLKNSNDLIGNWTCNLSASSTVPQSTTLLCAPLCMECFLYLWKTDNNRTETTFLEANSLTSVWLEWNSQNSWKPYELHRIKCENDWSLWRFIIANLEKDNSSTTVHVLWTKILLFSIKYINILMQFTI